MSQIPHVTEQSFASEVLASPVPVLVDFSATWCGPCRIAGRFLEALGPRFEGRVKIVKVDIDQEPGLAGAFEITGVPTMLFFAGGALVDSVVGLEPPDALAARLERVAARKGEAA